MAIGTLNTRAQTIGGIEFTAGQIEYARRWYNANNDEPLKGRIRHSVVLDWVAADMPIVQPPFELAATIFYRTLDSLGRPNGKTKQIEVDKNNMRIFGAGRPETFEYLRASTLNLRQVQVSRIVTAGGAIHSVRINEDGEFEFRWESKSDQKAVILWLMKTLATYRNAAVGAGIDVDTLDAEMDASAPE